MKINTANATLVGAILALVGVIAAQALAQWGAAKLEDRRARTEIIVEMMRSNDQQQVLQKLQVLSASGLLPDEDGKLRQAVSEAPKTAFVQVKVPVAVQPIKPSDVPPLPQQLGKRPNDSRRAALLALAGRCDALAFVIQAYPLLEVSAGLPPKQAPSYPECERR